MNKIILQPAGNQAATLHYQDTIARPVLISSVAHLLSKEELSDLNQIYSSGSALIWGATPGGNNETKWQRITTGDVTLFAKKGTIFSSAVVTYKLHAPKLAAHLWGTNPNGQTWEYVFFLDELQPLNIPYLAFNRAIGYADNFVIQGFTVLSADRSQPIFETFDLQSDTYVEIIDQNEFDKINRRLDQLENTDSEVKAYRRLEQGYLKDKLFGRRTIGTCAICHNEFPIALLVAAHIKKRADCNLEERKDANVVMPVCKFGCDDLFERGFISVIDGKVVSLHKQPTSTFVEKNIVALVGLTCKYYHDQTVKYFEAHRQSHQNKSL